MSVIHGTIQCGRDNRANLPALPQATALFGEERPGGNWSREEASLGQILQPWDLSAPNEQSPQLTADSRAIVAAQARLDNRETLYDRLCVTPVERQTMSDRTLLLRAYESWGEGCVNHLLGDWSFAVWDQHRRSLFIARDPCGNTCLYYYNDAKGFAFSSILKSLLALIEKTPALNERLIASILTKSLYGSSEETPYGGVYRLLPGHALTLINGRVAVRRYWSPDDSPEVRFTSDEAYVEAFLERYTQAVHCRLKAAPSICSTLSSGLDSGSVTAIAANAFSLQDKTLTAYTFAPPSTPRNTVGADRLANEWALAHEVAKAAGNITHQPLHATGTSPISALRRAFPLFGAPAYAPSNAYWLQALLDDARQGGFCALLTGQLGNICASWTPDHDYPLTLLHRGAWAAAWREIIHQTRSGGSMARAMASLLVRACNMDSLIRSSSRQAQLHHSAIHPTFAERIKLPDQIQESEHQLNQAARRDPRARQRQALLPMLTGAGQVWHELGTAWGIDVRDPTIDQRVIEYCLGIPVDQFRQNGITRWLFRRAMEGILPSHIQWNTRRGLQSADLGHRLITTRQEVESALNDVAASSLAQEYLNLPRMQAVWNNLQTCVDAKTTHEVATVLMGGLSIGFFLIALEGNVR